MAAQDSDTTSQTTGDASPLYRERVFYTPSKALRILALLDHIRFGHRPSQQQLGQATGLSPAMVNTYIKQLRAEGLIDMQPIDGKRVEYQLTQAGTDLASRQLEDFCAELVRIYASHKQAVRNRLQACLPPDIRGVALFGAAETCEVTLAVIQEMAVPVLAIVDNDPAKQGRPFNGYVVDAPAVLEACSCDAVIITSYARHQEIRRQIEPMLAPRGITICTL